MSRYRDNASKFDKSATAIFGVSVDSTWANKAFRESTGVEFLILSDSKKDVARQYGVLDEQSGFARRTTFVIDSAGIVRHIDQGRDALDPSGAINACSLLKKSSQP